MEKSEFDILISRLKDYRDVQLKKSVDSDKIQKQKEYRTKYYQENKNVYLHSKEKDIGI